jgi:hypothetical protein
MSLLSWRKLQDSWGGKVTKVAQKHDAFIAKTKNILCLGAWINLVPCALKLRDVWGQNFKFEDLKSNPSFQE